MNKAQKLVLLGIIAATSIARPYLILGQDQAIHPTVPGTKVRDYTKPGLIIEKNGDKTFAHPTLPGTEVRDYTKPSFILEQDGEKLTAYPTVAGTLVRDRSRDPIVLGGAKERNTGEVAAPQYPPRGQSSVLQSPYVNPYNKSSKEEDSPIKRQTYHGNPTPSLQTPKLQTPKFRTESPESVLPKTSTTINMYHPDSLANPYGAGSPYKPDGLMNPYSQNGSPYSDKSWRNPYATDAPKMYDKDGNYRGKLSTNPYDSDSVANPYGRYGSKYSPDSIKNPYGAGNPYSSQPIYVVPSKK